MFSIEFILAIALIVCAVILVISGFSSTRRALDRHTKLLKSQAAVISAAQHKVQADLHSQGTDEYEKAILKGTEAIKSGLHKTSTAMNAQVEKRIDSVLTHELDQYKASAADIGKISAAAIEGFQTAISKQEALIMDQLKAQHEQVSAQIESLVQTEKERRINQFETDMAKVVSSYINDALADQIDVDSQLEYILEQLEQNKKAIREDLQHAA